MRHDATPATLHDLIDHIEDVRQVVLSIDRLDVLVGQYLGDPDTHHGAAARDAIFNLERALDSALADARNTIRQATVRPRPKSPFLAGDDVLVYFDSRWYPAEVHSVEREVVAGHVVAVYVTGFQGRAEAIRFDHVDVVVR